MLTALKLLRQDMGSLSTTNSFEASKLLDPASFSKESKSIVDFITNYYENVDKYPVLSQVEPGYLSRKLPSSAPCKSEPLEDIMQDIKETIIPGLTHWQSPNFFGYFQANASTAGFLGEMLCSGLNVVCFNWISSPAATELESIVIDWMGQMLKLPSTFLFSGTGGGVLHGSTCEAAVCTLAAARDRALKQLGGGWDNLAKMVIYASDQTHFTFQKAAKLVGIPPRNFRHVKTSFSKGFSMDPEDLLLAIEEDINIGLIPLYLCGTVGTTPSGAVDPLKELGEIAQKFSIWFHVDAAYAGSACICPEFRPYLDGVELADSFSMNPHKWFRTNLDCCCLWLKEPRYLVESLSTKHEILKNSATESKGVIDYKDWQIALSRRFKALKLWMVIRRHGLANLMYHIRCDVQMAKQFEKLVIEDDRFEVVVPRTFALVCFRLKPKREEEGGELNAKLLDAVNSSGRAFMTHAVLGGIFVIRCAIGATLTEERHIQEVWKLIQEKASSIIGA